jgi:hypothetical protein
MKKFPRICHLPNSPNVGRDDRVLASDEVFNDKLVVVTEKLDGENTTIGTDFIYARSTDSGSAPWRSWVKKLQGEIGYKIPANFRVCGENMQGIHSIVYRSLRSAFYAFMVINWDIVLDWPDTVRFCKELGLMMVPVIYDGPYNMNAILDAFNDYQKRQPNQVEGFVMRNGAAFLDSNFDRNVAKFVRVNHVQTDEHWTRTWKEAAICL